MYNGITAFDVSALFFDASELDYVNHIEIFIDSSFNDWEKGFDLKKIKAL